MTVKRKGVGAWAWFAALFSLLLMPSVAGAQATSVIIDWEAPGDDFLTGTAHHYELRYSSVAIVGTDTTSWWNAATVVAGLPTPLVAGTTQSVTITAAFSAAVTYRVIMKTFDEVSNTSFYSNMASRTIPTDAVPVVNNPGSQTVARPATLSFTALATDADVGTVFIWSLDGGAPTGATINSSTGAFTWTPTEAQGPGTYPVTLRATDDWVPPASGSAAFSVTVTEVNVAPAVTSPGNRTVNELVALSFTFVATDADLPANVLTYSLEAGFPAGATINASSGAFSWTPTEVQGPNVYPIVFRATDNGVSSLSSSASITATINEVNVAPIVTNPGNRTVDELATLSFIAVANDADFPTNSIVWSMDGGGPPGSTLNSSSGQFLWTPTEAQGPGTYPVTIRATDSGTPNLSGTSAFVITVAVLNQVPVVTNPGNKTVNELATLSFGMTATDADVPADVLTWSIDAGAPAGASITPGSPGSATFSWTPTETHGPGDYPVTVRVTDDFTPAGSGTAQFNVTVNEVNVAPVITAWPQGVPSIPLTVGVPYSTTIVATDSDVPANTLRYVFQTPPDPPAGAALDSITGVFTWTPTIAESRLIIFKVRDNGSPVLSRTKTSTFTVTGGATPDTTAPAFVTSFVNVTGTQYSAVAPTKNQDGACPGGAGGTTLLDLMELRVYTHLTGASDTLLAGQLPASPGATVPIDVFLAAGSTGTIWSVAADSVGNESCVGTILAFSVPVPPGGLLGVYYDNADLTGTQIARTDTTVFFAWGDAAPFPAMGVNTFSVRWTGYVTPQHSETYAFYVTSDDGMVLWLDEVQVAGVWADHPVKEYKGFVDLLAGRQYAVRIEYYDNIEKALAKLFWSSTSTQKQIVPASALSH